MRRFAVFVVALLALSYALPVRAQREVREPVFTEQPSPARSVKPEQQYLLGEERWYGWQTLTADALGIALMVTGDNSDRFTAGAVTYLIASPLVHAVHGRAGAALGSLGLHALGEGVALLAFMSGCGDSYDPETGREEYTCEGGVARGASVLVLTSFVEAGALGWERERIPIAGPTPAPAPSVSFGLARRSDGFRVLVSGSF